MATINKPNRARPGRPTGSPPNREVILAAAKEEFAVCGFDRATIRGIAGRANVDPALLYHYFGSKVGLFSEVIRLPLNPREFALRILDGDVETIGERLLRNVLALWTANPASLAGLLHSVTSREEAPNPRKVLETITTAIQVPQPKLRAALVNSQIIGLALARFVIGIEPIVSASEDEVIAYYAPVFQHHLTGPLPGD